MPITNTLSDKGLMWFRLLLSALALHWCLVARAAPADDYRQGVEEFVNQNYQQALQHFTAARTGGMKLPTLTYNLGSVYFRLGQFDRAMAEYGSLANDAAWGALAHYNMGLIDEAQGRPVSAMDHYRQAYDRATSPKMKALAAAKLAAESSRSVSGGESWNGIVSVGAGSDDNVVLYTNDLIVPASDQQDYFAELRAWARGYVSGTLEKGWRMDLSGYYRAYSRQHDFDFGVGNVGLAYSRLFDNWYMESGVKIEAQTVGGQYLTSAAKVNFQALRPVAGVILRVRDEATYYQPDSAYEFIKGWQNRTVLDVTRNADRTRLQIGYELELNGRDDLVRTPEYFSYSPLRHKLFANVRYDVTGRLQLEGQLDFWSSKYQDKNALLNTNGSLTVASRSDDRWSGFARMAYQASKIWNWFAEYQYASNDSNFDRYHYTNHQVMLGAERVF